MDQQELIEGLLKQDQRACKYLFDQYEELISKVVARYVHNGYDAEEVVQDVFVKAIFKINQFNDESALKTWMVRIAINTSLNFLESEKKYQEMIEGGLEEFEELNLPSDTPDPLALLEFKETKSFLVAALSQLPDRQKTAFTLRYIHDMDLDDIAEIMDVSNEALESLLQRVRAKIKVILLQYQ